MGIQQFSEKELADALLTGSKHYPCVTAVPMRQASALLRQARFEEAVYQLRIALDYANAYGYEDMFRLTTGRIHRVELFLKRAETLKSERERVDEANRVARAEWEAKWGKR